MELLVEFFLKTMASSLWRVHLVTHCSTPLPVLQLSKDSFIIFIGFFYINFYFSICFFLAFFVIFVFSRSSLILFVSFFAWNYNLY